MFKTSLGNLANLTGLHRGGSAFLVCGGNSISAVDCTVFQTRGILTMGVNNVAAINIKPDLWVCGDNPSKFSDVIWEDPTITKFVGSTYLKAKLTSRQSSGIVTTDRSVRDMPNVFSYTLGSHFIPERWISESVCTWGDTGPGGYRSTMLIALKILFVLGVRTVYLLGCDFRMVPGKPYGFPENKDETACSYNNKLYEVLARRFELLKSYFKEHDFQVANCTEGSHLKVFPFVDMQSAIDECLKRMPSVVDTYGMYTFSSGRGDMKVTKTIVGENGTPRVIKSVKKFRKKIK